MCWVSPCAEEVFGYIESSWLTPGCLMKSAWCGQVSRPLLFYFFSPPPASSLVFMQKSKHQMGLVETKPNRRGDKLRPRVKLLLDSLVRLSACHFQTGRHGNKCLMSAYCPHKTHFICWLDFCLTQTSWLTPDLFLSPAFKWLKTKGSLESWYGLGNKLLTRMKKMIAAALQCIC